MNEFILRNLRWFQAGEVVVVILSISFGIWGLVTVFGQSACQ